MMTVTFCPTESLRHWTSNAKFLFKDSMSFQNIFLIQPLNNSEEKLNTSSYKKSTLKVSKKSLTLSPP